MKLIEHFEWESVEEPLNRAEVRMLRPCAEMPVPAHFHEKGDGSYSTSEIHKREDRQIHNDLHHSASLFNFANSPN